MIRWYALGADESPVMTIEAPDKWSAEAEARYLPFPVIVRSVIEHEEILRERERRAKRQRRATAIVERAARMDYQLVEASTGQREAFGYEVPEEVREDILRMTWARGELRGALLGEVAAA